MSLETRCEIRVPAGQEWFGCIEYYALADGRHAVEFGAWNRDRTEGSMTKVYFDTLEEAHRLLARLKK